MSQVHHIKSRISSAKNVGQITKAMELVSATKMRKAQEIALRSRPYAFAALELLETLSRHGKETVFSKAREIKTTLAVIIESDKGLAGAFNTQVERRADLFFKEDPATRVANHTYVVMPIGAKAHHFASGRFAVAQEFAGTGDFISLLGTRHIVEAILEGFISGRWDRVVVISMHFRTALFQEALVRELLPVTTEHIRTSIDQIIPMHGRFSYLREGVPVMACDDEYIFEPSPEILLEHLMPHLVTMQLYHSILEANASEHSARRVAMKTASDNADTLMEELTLQYNKVRQAGITNELIEIASTQEALAD